MCTVCTSTSFIARWSIFYIPPVDWRPCVSPAQGKIGGFSCGNLPLLTSTLIEKLSAALELARSSVPVRCAKGTLFVLARWPASSACELNKKRFGTALSAPRHVLIWSEKVPFLVCDLSACWGHELRFQRFRPFSHVFVVLSILKLAIAEVLDVPVVFSKFYLSFANAKAHWRTTGIPLENYGRSCTDLFDLLSRVGAFEFSHAVTVLEALFVLLRKIKWIYIGSSCEDKMIGERSHLPELGDSRGGLARRHCSRNPARIEKGFDSLSKVGYLLSWMTN